MFRLSLMLVLLFVVYPNDGFAALGEEDKTYHCTATCRYKYFYRSIGGDTMSKYKFGEVKTEAPVVAQDVKEALHTACRSLALEKNNQENFDKAKAASGSNWLNEYPSYESYLTKYPGIVAVITHKLGDAFIFRPGDACLEI